MLTKEEIEYIKETLKEDDGKSKVYIIRINSKRNLIVYIPKEVSELSKLNEPEQENIYYAAFKARSDGDL